jgi:hypothetical protein
LRVFNEFQVLQTFVSVFARYSEKKYFEMVDDQLIKTQAMI